MSRRTFISLVILLVIGLHAAPVLLHAERGTLWPFMRWTMYHNSRKPGPIDVRQRRLLAITRSGAVDTVTPYLVGLSITVLKQEYLGPIGVGDFSSVPELLERLNRGRTDSVAELRLESQTWTVTDSGIARTQNPVVTYRVP